MSETPLTLCLIDGDYGLVSFDADCIQTILYAKVAKFPVEVTVNHASGIIYKEPPCLKYKDSIITSAPKILALFKLLEADIDSNLTVKQRSECLALTHMVSMKLKSILEYTYWLDPRNCDDFTRRWFLKAIHFPFSYGYISGKRKAAVNLIEVLYPKDDNMDAIQKFLCKTVYVCLSTLSIRLGKLKYFYGDSPTSLDILVYSHLAPFIKLPFPSNEVLPLLSMWPNLTDLVERIDASYFPDVTKQVKYLKSEATVKHSDDEVSYTAVFILSVSAATLVVGFAVKRGYLNLSQWRWFNE